jgi:hypothetical protein
MTILTVNEAICNKGCPTWLNWRYQIVFSGNIEFLALFKGEDAILDSFDDCDELI